MPRNPRRSVRAAAVRDHSPPPAAWQLVEARLLLTRPPCLPHAAPWGTLQGAGRRRAALMGRAALYGMFSALAWLAYLGPDGHEFRVSAGRRVFATAAGHGCMPSAAAAAAAGASGTSIFSLFPFIVVVLWGPAGQHPLPVGTPLTSGVQASHAHLAVAPPRPSGSRGRTFTSSAARSTSTARQASVGAAPAGCRWVGWVGGCGGMVEDLPGKQRTGRQRLPQATSGWVQVGAAGEGGGRSKGTRGGGRGCGPGRLRAPAPPGRARGLCRTSRQA